MRENHVHYQVYDHKVGAMGDEVSGVRVRDIGTTGVGIVGVEQSV